MQAVTLFMPRCCFALFATAKKLRLGYDSLGGKYKGEGRRKKSGNFLISLFGDCILLILYVYAIRKKYLKPKRKTLFDLRFFYLSRGRRKRILERKNKEKAIHSQDK